VTNDTLQSKAISVSYARCLLPLTFPWLHATKVEGSSTLVRLQYLYSLCDLGRRLANFEAKLHENVTLSEMAVQYLELVHVLKHIQAGDIIELPITKRHATDLLEFLDQKVKTEQGDYRLSEPFSESDIGFIEDSLTRIHHALSDELSDMPIYWFRQVRAYSTQTLIENAEKVLNPDSLTAIPENAIQDVGEGAKCLAFGIPTSCGIHMMRAFEKGLSPFLSSVYRQRPRNYRHFQAD